MERTFYATGEDEDATDITAVLRALDLDDDSSPDLHFEISTGDLGHYSSSQFAQGHIDMSHQRGGEVWAGQNRGVHDSAAATSFWGEHNFSEIHENSELYMPTDVGSVDDPDIEDDIEDEDFGGAIMDFTSSALEVEDLLRRHQEASSKDDLLRGYGSSVDAIYAALFTSGGDTNYAVTLVLNAFYKMHSFKPCRHFMQGHCLRKDCAFSHDFSSVPCRYWLLEGPGCSNGDSCSFLHWVPELDANSSLCEETPALVVDDVDEFPSLTPIPKGKVLGGAKTAPAIPPNSLVKKPVVEQKVPVSSTNTPVTGPSKVPSSAASNNLSFETFGVHEWVASGRSVKATYETHRAAARQLAVSRNKLLQEATNAYMSGNKEIARRLSTKGRELNDEMKSHHKQAAQAIFQAQNNPESLRSGVLDVHGLHAAELVECLDSLVPYLRNYLKPKAKIHGRGMMSGAACIRVITGSGHHSSGPQKGVSRLLPAAEEYCASHNMAYSIIKDPNGYPCGVSIVL